jgi:biopolymer transport protein ExbD
MAGIQVEGRGRGGVAGANVNMVPMIDLLVSMIAFLLMAAVWTHTGQIQAQQPKAASDAPVTEPTHEELRVIVSADGFTIGHNAMDMHAVEDHDVAMTALRRALNEQRLGNPNGRDVWVQPDGAVSYERVIRVMDTIYDVWSTGETTQPRSRRVNVSLM